MFCSVQLKTITQILKFYRFIPYKSSKKLPYHLKPTVTKDNVETKMVLHVKAHHKWQVNQLYQMKEFSKQDCSYNNKIKLQVPSRWFAEV